MEGKGNTKLLIISCYRPCKGSTKGGEGTIWKQQWSRAQHLGLGEDYDPRQKMLNLPWEISIRLPCPRANHRWRFQWCWWRRLRWGRVYSLVYCWMQSCRHSCWPLHRDLSKHLWSRLQEDRSYLRFWSIVNWKLHTFIDHWRIWFDLPKQSPPPLSWLWRTALFWCTVLHLPAMMGPYFKVHWPLTHPCLPWPCSKWYFQPKIGHEVGPPCTPSPK